MNETNTYSETESSVDMFTEVNLAYENLNGVVTKTPLLINTHLSNEFGANIYFKREDLQVVRSYKIRGAYNKISSLDKYEKQKGVVCASAGNHAQGFAYSCRLLGLFGVIFMPVTTPKQKIDQVKQFGKEHVEIVLAGDTFDDAYAVAVTYASDEGRIFVHPFDDEKVIAGQGTVALEILEQAAFKIDYLFVPVGGGGLAAGVCAAFSRLSPDTKIIGAEPAGAASMKTALENSVNVPLPFIDKFVDGAAVKKVGDLTFEICKEHLYDMLTVPEGKVCSTILRLYNEQGLVVEPAGALSVAALDQYKEKLKGKNVVCVISGSNNDITRTEEIRERSLLYEGLKHYFLINFPQRPGALKEFLNEVLGENDDISYFQFSKKNNRERGPAVVGLELKDREDFKQIRRKLDERKISYTYLNEHPDLFTHLIG